MQIVPQTQAILHLAGYMIARACVVLARGEAPGVDLGRAREDGSMQVEAQAARYEGALAQGRALLAAPPQHGVVAQVLVHSQRMAIEGTPFTEALVAEIADAAGPLTGVVLALPWQPAQGKRELAMHSLRVVACPPALRPLADDVLGAFAQGMRSFAEGYSAWMRALVYETEESPRPPADLRDPDAWACAIHANDPQADSNAKAAAHLQAFLDQGGFEGGLGFEKALRGVTLDFSLASLDALDALLDRLCVERKPRPEAFLSVQAGLNFLHLVAIYLGETMAQAAGATAAWCTHAQLESVEPGRLDGESDAATALVCVFNGHGPGTGLVFLALDVVACRLFGKSDAPTLAATAQAALPAIHAARRTDLIDPGSTWAATPERGAMLMTKPQWISQDAMLSRWFDSLPTLWRSGRVVWGRLVQANNHLFQPGPHDLPGQIVYDPSGRTDPEGLDAVAQNLFGLKGTRPRNPSLAFIAGQLTHERTGANGFPVPATLGARGLRTSTLLFHRPHMPGGRMSGHVFPVLVSDAAPGVVMMLPARFWPEPLRRRWA